MSVQRHVAGAALLALFAPAGCESVHVPSEAEMQALEVVDAPDPARLEPLGHVDTRVRVDEDDRAAQAKVLREVRRRALMRHPDAEVLRAVDVRPAETLGSVEATAIVAKRRGG